ncbi:MAG: 7-cyano-7-deazaguanine synthase QueC [Candidatus Hydrogenedentota bacterium]|nr:MAG: 7-cyano-7-deazaguanine synthase QueC [Candidatus Hydrogenedentota bacterium]
MTESRKADAQTTPAVVLLSGGLDSTVLLHHVAMTLEYSPIHAVSFDYGQRHARELECAEYQATAVGVHSHTVLDISFFGELVQAGTSLVEGGGAVPDLADVSPADRDQPPTYVPNRNMMLLSIAAAYAEAQGISDIFYGAQAQDEYGYWDCTADFLERINAILQLNRKTPVVIHAPFMDRKKEALVLLGQELGVDFAHTWSCYRGGKQPCDTCPTCVERRNAFTEAGLSDPLGE